MNVVHSGDHVFLAIPATSASHEVKEFLAATLAKVPEALKDFPGIITMSWLPIGPPGSEPYVLFVARPEKP